MWLLFKIKTEEGGHDVDCEILIPKFGSTDRACVKSEGLVFHGTGRAIRLINSLLFEDRQTLFFTKYVQKSQGFPLWHYHIISAESCWRFAGCRAEGRTSQSLCLMYFLILKVGLMWSFKLVFCKYFFTVAYYSVYMHCEHRQNSED